MLFNEVFYVLSFVCRVCQVRVPGYINAPYIAIYMLLLGYNIARRCGVCYEYLNI